MFLSRIPDCIYDQNNDTVYFYSIQKAYGIFNILKKNYKNTTEEDVRELLESDIINLEGFNNQEIGLQNRKRISKVMEKIRTYNPEQKEVLKAYIHSMSDENLTYEGNNFKITNNKELELFLMGASLRLYDTPLQDGTQVATATTSLQKLME